MSEYWSAICDWDMTGVYSAVEVWMILFLRRRMSKYIYDLRPQELPAQTRRTNIHIPPLNFYTLNREKSLGGEGGETCPPRWTPPGPRQ